MVVRLNNISESSVKLCLVSLFGTPTRSQHSFSIMDKLQHGSGFPNSYGSRQTNFYALRSA